MCPFFEVPCPLGKCKERMMRKEIPEHLAWKCKYRESTCEFCKNKMPLTELQVRPSSDLNKSTQTFTRTLVDLFGLLLELLCLFFLSTL